MYTSPVELVSIYGERKDEKDNFRSKIVIDLSNEIIDERIYFSTTILNLGREIRGKINIQMRRNAQPTQKG